MFGDWNLLLVLCGSQHKQEVEDREQNGRSGDTRSWTLEHETCGSHQVDDLKAN